MSFAALGRIAEMWRLVRWTKRHFDQPQNRPDVLICVDSPAINFHFAKVAHDRGIPVLYYIAPQLWAWREGRMHKLRKRVKHVACILPFEEEYFRRHGVPATFVGHPLFDQLPPGRAGRTGPRFPEVPPVIGLLPGSRKSEAHANFPHLLDVARRIRQAFPKVSFLVPTTPATTPIVQELADEFNRSVEDDSSSLPTATIGVEYAPKPGLVRYAMGEFDRLVPQCDLCITVSGTATLHVAGHGVPMIVVYRGNPVLWHGIGRWLFKTRIFSLVNLLSESREQIVPEYVPWYGSNEPVANLAIDFLRNPHKLAEQRQKLHALVKKLDHPGASMNVARLALSLMEGHPADERPTSEMNFSHGSKA
jgi:lipid-A-disaccharide synthase